MERRHGMAVSSSIFPTANQEEGELSTEGERQTELPPMLTFHYMHNNFAVQRDSNSDGIASDSPPSKSSNSSHSDFQFVNISEPAEMKGKENKRLVRRSVAFSHRRKQVQRHSTANKDGNLHHACLDTDLNSNSTLNYCPVCGYSLRKKRTSRPSNSDEGNSVPPETGSFESILGSGRGDPFATFPIPPQPYMYILIDHYLTKYCPTLQPFGKWDCLTSPIITRLFRLAIQNPIYFHAILCTAATHFNISSGEKTFKTIACHHRGEAIKLLNETLQENSFEVPDIAVAAVASLAHHDIMVGDVKALENHRRGLIAMIKIRGGIQKSGLDSLIKYRALWIDMLGATYTDTKPFLPVDDPTLTSSLQQNHAPNISTTGFNCLQQSSTSYSPLIQILQELLSLTAETQSLQGVRLSGTQLLACTARRSWIEWALTTMQPVSIIEDEQRETGDIENCCRLATLTYINIVLRKMPCASAVLSHFSSKLRMAMERTDMKSMWEGKTDLLIWVLFQGGAASTDKETRKWYVTWLVYVAKVLDLQAWKDVMLVLDKFLWVRCDLVKLCKLLWHEIAIGLSTFEL